MFDIPRPAPLSLYAIERELYAVRAQPEPADWARRNFRLSTAYAIPGPFIPHPYQVEPINAIKTHDKVILCWSTQLGKSLSAEIMLGWCIDNLPMNAMLCYAKRDTVEDVFEDRIKPLILQVPAIRKYFTGTEKDLRRKKIKLVHMFLRVASSEVPSDIATWAAGLIYASEVAKYRQRKGWDALESLKRRQEAYRIMGRHKAIFESSPLKIGDALHQEMHTAGVVILKPHYPCPNCGKLVHLTYTQIKEKPNEKGEYDHDPERIRRDGAAWYECPHCKKEISEARHREMCASQPDYRSGEDSRKSRMDTDRGENISVAYQVNRLVDPSYTFTECLARWFHALRKGGSAMQTFINEDMADFWAEKTIQIGEDYLQTRIQQYRQFKTGDIPNEVLLLLAGADVQDDGFFFTVSGYGKGMDKWLVRCGFIAVPKGLSAGGADPRQTAYERFQAGVYAQPYTRRDGRSLSIHWGFVDRGGHRADDVDYITEHLPEWHGYVGLTQVDYKRPMISHSEQGPFWVGQSQLLSINMTQVIASSRYHLPSDIQPDFLTQVRNEYMEQKMDVFGNTRQVYVKIEPNHYRSCENLTLAAVEECGIRDALFTPEGIVELERRVQQEQAPQEDGRVRPVDANAPSEYFSNRRGRRY